MSSQEVPEVAYRVLSCARRVLVAGICDDALALFLRDRGVAEIHALAERGRTLAAFDSVVPVLPTWEAQSLPFPAQHFDAIVLCLEDTYIEQASAWIVALMPFLAPDAHMIVEAANEHYCRGSGRGTNIGSMKHILETAGLQLYAIHRGGGEDELEAEPDGEYLIVDGRRMHAPDADARLALLTPVYQFVGIRPDYNPLDHANARFDAGHPDQAYEILSQLPAACFDDPHVAASIHSSILLCQLALDRDAADMSLRLKRLMTAQWSFYGAIARFPYLHAAYRTQAEIWHRLGNTDMAVRLLRSIQHVAPNEGVANQLAGYGTPVRRAVRADTPPVWEPPDRMPRILFITHARPHFGLDVLYDGLCTVLGAENVTEYPWKPSLHGKPPDKMENYPCVFDHPGKPLALEEVLRALGEGMFDAVLFGDIEQSLSRASARRLAAAARGTPLFICDAQDTCDDTRAEMAKYLGVESVAGFFKREMLIGIDYGPNAFPLPFAYPDARVPSALPDERRFDLFWAGHRDFGLRRLYLERLEALTGQSFQFGFPQEDYIKVMQASRVGLNIFGAGYDTVRYWELPAHGCMLLTERLPIRIPYAFRDDETALVFDDMRELEVKLAYCIGHRDAAAAIARAGREHFLKYHTASARAKQALAWMRQCGAFGVKGGFGAGDAT